MSNAQRKGRRASSATYATRGRAEANKRRRIARDEARRKPLPCGHGKRHLSPYDGRCRRCFARTGAV